jgi:hypothetical protein
VVAVPRPPFGSSASNKVSRPDSCAPGDQLSASATRRSPRAMTRGAEAVERHVQATRLSRSHERQFPFLPPLLQALGGAPMPESRLITASSRRKRRPQGHLGVHEDLAEDPTGAVGEESAPSSSSASG